MSPVVNVSCVVLLVFSVAVGVYALLLFNRWLDEWVNRRGRK